jgi:pimeloyl-ACP methyl ester carboxylesterase
VTIVLDEPCIPLRETLETIAPVFVFRRRLGFLATPAGVAANELHAALEAEEILEPYVLVAASFGGFTALAYAACHPTALAGLVLIDSSHPEQGTTALAALPVTEVRTVAVDKFLRYLQGFGPVWKKSCQTIARISDLGDLPIIVLAAGSPDMPTELSDVARQGLTRSWHHLQRRHASLSTRGELRILPGVGHNIAAAAPEAIVAAVRYLVGRGNL